MTDSSEWEGRVGRKWADEWRRTDRSFRELTPRLLEVAVSRTFERVLDIGCGAGGVSIALAQAAPEAEVRGVDISEDLLVTARNRAGQLANATFELADAAVWSREDFAPDLLVSRHGVMFFADPVAAFEHLASSASTACRLAFTCFRSLDENAWASEVTRLLPGPAPAPDPAQPGPFAFADPKRVERILGAAGWRDIALEPVDFAYCAGEADDPVADALNYLLLIGPAARGAAGLEGDARLLFIDRLRELLADRSNGQRVTFPAAAWLVTAHHG